MNKDNINKVIAAIEAASAERFIMSYPFNGLNYCNTAACVAGWALMVRRKEELDTLKLLPIEYDEEYSGFDLKSSMGTIHNYAREILGLNRDQASDLFYLESDHHEAIETICEAIIQILDRHDISPDIDHRYYADATLSLFDRLPAEIRKRAAINVLLILRDTGVVHWRAAIKLAS